MIASGAPLKRFLGFVPYALAAGAVASPSVLYPFGRDQGLFYYVGREWVLRGAVPYRDVWDHKPPLIYVLHAAAIVLFGERLWGIRVCELVLMLGIGWLAARLVTQRRTSVYPPTWGIATLSGVFAYHGCLGFWDTAQCEIWAAAAALASVTVVIHGSRSARSAVAGGILGAIALWFKPPALFLLTPAFAALMYRAIAEAPDGRRARCAFVAFVRYGVGVLAFSALIAGYFALHGALDEMIDILVFANAYYVEHEATEPGLANFWVHVALFETYGGVVLLPLCLSIGAIGVALWRRRWSQACRYGFVPLWMIATALGVWIQRKAYIYHWGPVAIGVAVFGALICEDTRRAFASRFGERAAWLPSVGIAASAVILFFASRQGARHAAECIEALRYVSGYSTRGRYYSRFEVPVMGFSHVQSERVARFLRARAAPNDTLAVRGFEPQIYAMTGLHYTGRFYWTTFLTDSRRAYRRNDYRREDARALARHPPRFVVAYRRWLDEIDRCAWFAKHGYKRVFTAGNFCVLARRKSGPR